MLTMEVQCRPGFNLVEAFRRGIQEDEFRSFALKRGASRSRRRAEVVHKSPRTPGSIRLEQLENVCLAKVTAPQNKEWDILHKFVGRLVHRFSDRILGLVLVFPQPKRRR